MDLWLPGAIYTIPRRKPSVGLRAPAERVSHPTTQITSYLVARVGQVTMLIAPDIAQNCASCTHVSGTPTFEATSRLTLVKGHYLIAANERTGRNMCHTVSITFGFDLCNPCPRPDPTFVQILLKRTLQLAIPGQPGCNIFWGNGFISHHYVYGL